jgi:hypothetical protein
MQFGFVSMEASRVPSCWRFWMAEPGVEYVVAMGKKRGVEA